MHLARYWWKLRKSNPLCCCWSLSHRVSARSAIDCGLWSVKSQHSGLSLCHRTLLCSSGVSPGAGTAPGLEAQQKGRRCVFSRLLLSQTEGWKRHWLRTALLRERREMKHSFMSPSQCPHLPPSLSQACLFQLSPWFHTGILTLQVPPGHMELHLSVPRWKDPGSPANLWSWETTAWPEPPLPVLLCLC